MHAQDKKDSAKWNGALRARGAAGGRRTARILNDGCPAGMPGSAPSFGSGPEHVLPGGRAMAAPLGGGEYVQDKRSPGNRIEPHTMPRPTASLADPPLVSHLRLSSVMQPGAQAAESMEAH